MVSLTRNPKKRNIYIIEVVIFCCFVDNLASLEFPVKGKANHVFYKMPQQLKRKLTPEELRERLRDPNFLPSRKQIMRAFQDYTQWRDFCFNKEDPVFEFFNEDYLNAFVDYLINRVQDLGKNEKNPLTILELGAGNGKFSHFLKEKIETRAPGQTKIIPTDSGKWNFKKSFPVKKLNHLEALKRYRPDLVIFSWMPYKKDVSKDIRKFDSVKEYILIGEINGGCCGDEWET